VNELQGCKSESWLNCLLSLSLSVPRLGSIQCRSPSPQAPWRCYCGARREEGDARERSEAGIEDEGEKVARIGAEWLQGGKLEILIAVSFPVLLRITRDVGGLIRRTLMRSAAIRDDVISGHFKHACSRNPPRFG